MSQIKILVQQLWLFLGLVGCNTQVKKLYVSCEEVGIFNLDTIFESDNTEYVLEDKNPVVTIMQKMELHRQYGEKLGKTEQYDLHKVSQFLQNVNYLGEWQDILYVLYNNNTIHFYNTNINYNNTQVIQTYQFFKYSGLQCYDLHIIEENTLVVDCISLNSSTHYGQQKYQNFFVIVRWENNDKQIPSDITHKYIYNLNIYSSSFTNREIRGFKQNGITYLIRNSQLDWNTDKPDQMFLEIFRYLFDENTIECIDVVDHTLLNISSFKIKSVAQFIDKLYISDPDHGIFIFQFTNGQFELQNTINNRQINILDLSYDFSVGYPVVFLLGATDYIIYEYDCTDSNNIILVWRYQHNSLKQPHTKITQLKSSLDLLFVQQQNILDNSTQLLILRRDNDILFKIFSSFPQLIKYFTFDESTKRLMVITDYNITTYQISSPYLLVNATSISKYNDLDLSVFLKNGENIQEKVFFEIFFIDNNQKNLVQDTQPINKIYSYSSINGRVSSPLSVNGNDLTSTLEGDQLIYFDLKLFNRENLDIYYQDLDSNAPINFNINELYDFIYFEKGLQRTKLEQYLIHAFQSKIDNKLYIFLCTENSNSIYCILEKLLELTEQNSVAYSTISSKEIITIILLMAKSNIYFKMVDFGTNNQECGDIDAYQQVFKDYIVCTQTKQKRIVIYDPFDQKELQVIDNSIVKQKYFSPTQVQITDMFPTVLFIRNLGNIIVFDVGYEPMNIPPRLIYIFEDQLTKNDQFYKMQMKLQNLLIISHKFQQINEYKIINPNYFLMIRTFNNSFYRYNLNKIQHYSTQSKFFIVQSQDNPQQINILQSSIPRYKNIFGVIDLKQEVQGYLGTQEQSQKKNEELRNIEIAQAVKEYDILLIYTNNRIQFIRLYQQQTMDFYMKGKPKSNTLELFQLQIITQNKLNQRSQLLNVYLWNTHTQLSSSQKYIEVTKKYQTQNSVVYSLRKDQELKGQILKRKLECSIKEECQNQQNIKIRFYDNINQEYQSFHISNQTKIIQLQAYDNIILVLTEKEIYGFQTADITKLVLYTKTVKDNNKYSQTKNYIFAYDEYSGYLVIIKRDKQGYTLNVYNVLSSTLGFVSSQRIILLEQPQVRLIDDFLYILQKYKTTVTEYSCITIYHFINRLVKPFYIVKRLDNIDFKHNINIFDIWKKSINEYIVYIARQRGVIESFQILRQSNNNITFQKYYDINLLELDKYIDPTSSIVQIKVSNTHQQKNQLNLVVLTQDSNHIELLINQQTGQILKVLNLYVKYGNCKVTSESIITSQLISVICLKFKQQSIQMFVNRNLHYIYIRNIHNTHNNTNEVPTNFVVNEIIRQNLKQYDSIQFTSHTTRNYKLWIVKDTRKGYSILEYTYSNELLIEVMQPISNLTSQSFEIVYLNQFSTFRQRILLRQSDYPLSSKTIQIKGSIYLLIISLLFILILLIAYCILIQKYCLKEQSQSLLTEPLF